MSGEIPERQPYHFPWLEKDGHEFLLFVFQNELLPIEKDSTSMCLFPDQPEFDHIFIAVEEVEGGWLGQRIFRREIDELAPGAFSDLCETLFDHDFALGEDEEPSEDDIEDYMERYGSLPSEAIETTAVDRTEEIDKIVKLAMENLDAEIDYYLGE